MTSFLRVKNWERYQHYKDRNPPWVKLYTSWSDDYEWSKWDDASKLLAMCSLMLAAKLQNRIPNDPKWIQQRLSLTKVPDLSALTAAGFLEEIREGNQSLQDTEHIASTMLADCKHSASDALALARSREETETDRGERQRRARRSHRVPPDFLPDREMALRELPDLDYEREVQRFRDCEFSKARSDWPATWRTWIATCREGGKYARAAKSAALVNGQLVNPSNGLPVLAA